jgi:hypothetical protein
VAVVSDDSAAGHATSNRAVPGRVDAFGARFGHARVRDRCLWPDGAFRCWSRSLSDRVRVRLSTIIGSPCCAWLVRFNVASVVAQAWRPRCWLSTLLHSSPARVPRMLCDLAIVCHDALICVTAWSPPFSDRHEVEQPETGSRAYLTDEIKPPEAFVNLVKMVRLDAHRANAGSCQSCPW